MKEIISLNNDWLFFYGKADKTTNFKDLNTEKVNLPHTWNNLDGQDGGNDYKRGTGWYLKKITVKKEDGRRCFLEFYGVNSVANVYVNGVHIGEHRGGYTLFRFDVTDALIDGENTIFVCADNSPFPDVIPLEADFTFFGGIYREVKLIFTDEIHFALDNFGSEGVKVSYNNDESLRDLAKLNIKADISGKAENCTVNFRLSVPESFEECPYITNTDCDISSLYNTQGECIAESTVKIAEGKAECNLEIKNPRLWDGRKMPFRYVLSCSLLNENGTVTDTVTKYIGFRYFKIDPKKGFFLNGRQYPLRGVNRHQDRKDMGNAITYNEHDEDFGMIYEMGANAIRLAHYPHHPHFYELCDKYGLLVWAEIPFVDHIGGLKESPLPTDAKDSKITERQLENAKEQLTELILQQCHRPSIFCWSVSNEVQHKYGETAERMMNELDALVHSLDNTRYSALATNHNQSGPWKADIKGCNIYPGWYAGSVKAFRSQYNYYRRSVKNRCVAVSEYGAGANILHHTERPRQPKDTTCEFHSEEWAAIVHEHALKYFMSPSANKVWGTFVWNMFDFAVDIRKEGGMPGMNDKGLVTYDRKTKKDAFFIYKSYWSREPVVYITSRRFTERENPKTDVKIYSNADSVTLYLNGKEIKTKKNSQNRQNHIFIFRKITLSKGKNTVSVSASNGAEDTAVWTLI